MDKTFPFNSNTNQQKKNSLNYCNNLQKSRLRIKEKRLEKR